MIRENKINLEKSGDDSDAQVLGDERSGPLDPGIECDRQCKRR